MTLDTTVRLLWRSKGAAKNSITAGTTNLPWLRMRTGRQKPSLSLVARVRSRTRISPSKQAANSLITRRARHTRSDMCAKLEGRCRLEYTLVRETSTLALLQGMAAIKPGEFSPSVWELFLSHQKYPHAHIPSIRGFRGIPHCVPNFTSMATSERCAISSLPWKSLKRILMKTRRCQGSRSTCFFAASFAVSHCLAMRDRTVNQKQ